MLLIDNREPESAKEAAQLVEDIFKHEPHAPHPWSPWLEIALILALVLLCLCVAFVTGGL